MIDLSKVYKRVSRWNGARYDREYNHELSCALMKEEHSEWLAATELVDQLDALCDQIYVAMGVLWKINIDEESNHENFSLASDDLDNLIKANVFMPGYAIAAVLAHMEFDNEYPVAYAAHMVINCCLSEMGRMGLSHENMESALMIVCDSNDTKPVKKFTSDTKATKGLEFIKPEPRLQALLDNLQI